MKAWTAASWGVPAVRVLSRGCSTASDMKLTPKMVSGRVVKMVIVSSQPSTGKSQASPVLLPIQLRCMVTTFSGQPVSLSRSASSSSA